MIQIKRKVRLRQKTIKTALPTQSSSKKWSLVALVAVLLLGGGYLWYNNGTKSSESTLAQVESSVDNSTDPTTTDGTPTLAEEQGTVPAPQPTKEGVAIDVPATDVPVPASVGESTSQPMPTSSAKPSASAKSTAKPATAAATPASVASDVEVVAREVIQGRYGNGDTRKQQLGARYSEVQQRVNELYRKGLAN